MIMMMTKRRRAQASLEFLTSYGWMIMIAAVVAAALAYFGVFSPERNLPQQCDLGYDFSCDQYVLRTDGSVLVHSTNKLGEPVQVMSFTCIYENGDSHQDSPVPANTWGAGDAMDVGCSPSSPVGGLEEGKRAQVKLRLEYQKKSGGFRKTVEGRIVANPVATP